MDRNQDSFHQFTLTPPGWIMNSAALAWAVLCFYAEMMDKSWDALPKIGWALGAWLLGYWILKRVLVRGNSIRAQSIRRAVGWFTIPIVVPSVWLIMRMEIPRRVGFEISRPALNAAAQSALASPTPLNNQTGGLYQVYESRVYHGHVTLDTEGGEFVRVNKKSPDAASMKYGKLPLDDEWYFSVKH